MPAGFYRFDLINISCVLTAEGTRARERVCYYCCIIQAHLPNHTTAAVGSFCVHHVDYVQAAVFAIFAGIRFYDLTLFFFEGLPHHYKKYGRVKIPAHNKKEEVCASVRYSLSSALTSSATRTIFTPANWRTETPSTTEVRACVADANAAFCARLNHSPLRTTHGMTSQFKFLLCFFSP